MKSNTKFNIILSEKFTEVLKEFEAESQVARLLLGKEEGELVDEPANYISVSDQDMTKISYLSKDRIEKIQKDFSVENGYSSLAKDNVLWTSPIRFFGRPGSFIGKMFKNIHPKEVEKFSNLYVANVNKPKFKFEIVRGEEIRDFYHYETYSQEGCGSLGNSCMKHEGCQKFLNMYVENKEIFSMLIMLDPHGALMGRALLWTYESYKIMDRIYTINDERLLFYFKKWATDNGYLYKSEQNWYNTLCFESLNNKKQELKLAVKLPISEYRYYPYVDTFKWLNLETGTVSNFIPETTDKRNVKTLASSDGGSLDYDYIILDGIDNLHRYRNECAFIDYLSLWTYQGNANYSEVNGKWILHKDAMFDNDINDYIFNEEMNHMNNIPLIEEMRKSIRERREQEASRRALRRSRESSVIQNLADTIANGGSIDQILSEISITSDFRHYYQEAIPQESVEEPTNPEPTSEGEGNLISFDIEA